MKASVYETQGAPSVLHLAEVPDPIPAPHEVLIRVEAISLEGGDLIWRKTVLQENGDILGYAAAGEIIKLGADVKSFKIGQKVTSFNFKGSHASLRAVPEAQCFLVPNGLDIKTAAAIPVGPGTAAFALQMGELKKGQTVLITGAAGGVGLAAVQLAAKAGARVIGTGTSKETLDKLRSFGLTDAILVSDGNASEQVRTLLSGNKVDLLIDNVGGASLLDAIQVVKDGGCVVLVGVFGGLNTPIDGGYLLFHRLTVKGCMFGYNIAQPETRPLLDSLLKDAMTGELKVPIDASYPLSEAAAAHTHAEKRGRIGRIVMIP